MLLASVELVMEEPLKKALLLVSLSKEKDYTALVTSLKTFRDQIITLEYTVIRLPDEYVQLNRPTPSEKADTGVMTENEMRNLASSSINRGSGFSRKEQNISTATVRCSNCGRIGHYARHCRPAIRDGRG